MDAIYEAVTYVLSHGLLAALLLIAFVSMIYTEFKIRRKRHGVAASFLFLWLVFETLLMFDVMTFAGAVALSRVAVAVTAVSTTWIAMKDLRQ